MRAYADQSPRSGGGPVVRASKGPIASDDVDRPGECFANKNGDYWAVVFVLVLLP